MARTYIVQVRGTIETRRNTMRRMKASKEFRYSRVKMKVSKLREALLKVPRFCHLHGSPFRYLS